MALVFVHSSSAWISSLSLYLSLLTVVPIGLALAPQPIRKDKRVKVLLVLLALSAIGIPAYAAVTNFCHDIPWYLWPIECWLF
jgi:hypothetical protein